MEAKLKHLEFIQGAIARMSTHSFLFKGWAITIAAALSAFASARSERPLVVISLASTLMFWGLDGYYLWIERGFVLLHDRVAAMDDAAIDFSMTIDHSDAFKRWMRTCVRWHLLAFYGIIIVIEVVGIFMVESAPASQ